VKKRLLRVLDRHNGTVDQITHDILAEIAVRSRTIRQARRREEEREDEARLAREARAEAHPPGCGGAGQPVAGPGLMGWFSVEQRRRAIPSRSCLLSVRMRFAWRRKPGALRGAVHRHQLGQGNYREALAQLAAAVEDDPVQLGGARTAGRPLVAPELAAASAAALPARAIHLPGLRFWRRSLRGGVARRTCFVRGNLSRDLTTGQQG